MRVFVREDEISPVYNVRVDGEGFAGMREIDLPVDLETVAQWQDALETWRRANAEIRDLIAEAETKRPT